MTQGARRHIKYLFKTVIVIADLILICGFVASAWGGVINPNTSVYGAVIALGFPIFLGLMLLALVATLIWFRWLAVVNAVALIACCGPILTYCPLNFFRPSENAIVKEDKKTLRLLTFNILDLYIYNGDVPEGGNPTMAYILDTDADIVTLQEAADILTPGFQGVDSIQRSRLLEKYPYHDVTSRGMAFFSKYPFEPVDVDYKDHAQLDLCGFDVDLDGRKIRVFNVHMQSIGLTAEDKKVYVHITEGEAADETDAIRSGLISKLTAAFRSRADQAEDIRRVVEGVGGDVILAGDFNDIPGSYAYRTVADAGLTDAYRQAGLGPAITYHADRFYFRIDQIFYRGDLEALRTWRGDCPTSDHYPLLCIFELK